MSSDRFNLQQFLPKEIPPPRKKANSSFDNTLTTINPVLTNNPVPTTTTTHLVAHSFRQQVDGDGLPPLRPVLLRGLPSRSHERSGVGAETSHRARHMAVEKFERCGKGGGQGRGAEEKKMTE
jgi:hypothetical protein